ncbi:MAG: DUF1003 domain-containing protein [Solirubrobacteraceae bacterium]
MTDKPVAELKALERTALDPLRHHKHYQPDADGNESPYAGGSSFMERVSESVASGMGTVGFILISSGIIVIWIAINGVVPFVEHTVKAIIHGGQFDPEPWILLNLIFSAVAFYTGALVIIAQKAQTRTDKANEEAAAKHRDELSALHTELLQQNVSLTTQVHDLSTKLTGLMEEVHAATCTAH